ncbi:MAG: hypothetical protein ACOCRK_03615 [bacterium]
MINITRFDVDKYDPIIHKIFPNLTNLKVDFDKRFPSQAHLIPKKVKYLALEKLKNTSNELFNFLVNPPKNIHNKKITILIYSKKYRASLLLACKMSKIKNISFMLPSGARRYKANIPFIHRPISGFTDIEVFT